MKEQVFLNGNKSKEPTIQIQKTTYLMFCHACANQAPITNHPVTQCQIPNKDLNCTTAKKPNDYIFLNSTAILPVILSCALCSS